MAYSTRHQWRNDNDAIRLYGRGDDDAQRLRRWGNTMRTKSTTNYFDALPEAIQRSDTTTVLRILFRRRWLQSRPEINSRQWTTPEGFVQGYFVSKCLRTVFYRFYYDTPVHTVNNTQTILWYAHVLPQLWCQRKTAATTAHWLWYALFKMDVWRVNMLTVNDTDG